MARRPAVSTISTSLNWMLRRPQRARTMASGCCPMSLGKEIHADFCRQRFQLLDCRGPVDVGTDHVTFLLSRSFSSLASLATRGGFTRALQARHQDHGGRLCREVEPLVGRAHNALQLSCTMLRKAWPGLRLFITSWPRARSLHLVDEILDHRQRDIGLQQRHAHFAQRLLDVLLAQARLAGNPAQGLGKSFTQGVKHAADPLSRRGRR